ncbi:MAG TPA: sugar kinase [bacterium]
MPGSERSPDIVALGEPMAEFAAVERGELGVARTFRRGFGGDTANFIVAAARMGSRCGYITRLGGDEFGRAFISLWAESGIDYSQVRIDPERRTAVYFIARRPDGGHDFTYYRTASAASHLRPEDLDAAYLSGIRVLHTSGISQAISDSARATVRAAIDIVSGAGGTISYDANIRPALWSLDLARDVAERTFGRAQLVFLSSEDASHLYPGGRPGDVVRRVLERGPRLVVMKLGADGCMIAPTGGAVVELPGWSVDAVDSTGAGDAFAGAFVSAWLDGASPEAAGSFANAVGALTVMGLGAADSIPTRPAALTFLEKPRIGHHHRRE